MLPITPMAHMAIPAGLEPALSAVTGQHFNHLNYGTIFYKDFDNIPRISLIMSEISCALQILLYLGIRLPKPGTSGFVSLQTVNIIFVVDNCLYWRWVRDIEPESSA